MAVKVILRNEEILLDGPLTVEEALARLNIPPEHYLVVKNGEMAELEEPLSDGDVLRLVGVISGG
jgi:sulfur carrier protein ThiS